MRLKPYPAAPFGFKMRRLHGKSLKFDLLLIIRKSRQPRPGSNPKQRGNLPFLSAGHRFDAPQRLMRIVFILWRKQP
jgi:hypothetical protein